MKKLIAMLSAAVLTAVSIPFSVSAEELIAVNAANFPDDNFRKYISSVVDRDGDGYISDFENSTSDITLTEEAGEIKSVKGIELLTQLRTLYIGNCGLTEADISQNTELVGLAICDNSFSHIDISKNTKLEAITLRNSGLTEIDISNKTNLKSLDILNSPVITVALGNNVNLENLYLYKTNISSIDLTGCPNLKDLDISEASITSLDLSAAPLLEIIDIYKCNIENLDISNNTALKTIDLRETGLKEIDLAGHPVLEGVSLLYNDLSVIDTSDCPALKALSVDRNPITYIDVTRCPELEYLSFDQCDEVTEIDVSNNPLLKSLEIGKKISKLDVTNCPELRRLKCTDSEITELDLSNNILLEELEIEFCFELRPVDLSKNTELKTLWCTGYNDPFLNVDNNLKITDFRKPASLCSINIKGESIDLAEYDGFDPSRLTSITNAHIEGSVVTVINPRETIYYTYNAGGVVGDQEYTCGVSSVEIDSSLAREIPPQEYTGKEIRPVPELYCGEEQITAIDTEYENNTEIGTATVTVSTNKYSTFYKGSVTLEFEIVKATPEYEVPENLTAVTGQKLGTIKLPKGFSWEEPDTVLDSAGTVTATVTYTPEDTEHYNSVGGIKVSIEVSEPLKGDVNMDGKIDITDATLVLNYYSNKGAGKEPVFSDDTSANEKIMLLADVNNDGIIDITDASLILTYYAKAGAGIDISWEDILK